MLLETTHYQVSAGVSDVGVGDWFGQLPPRHLPLTPWFRAGDSCEAGIGGICQSHISAVGRITTLVVERVDVLGSEQTPRSLVKPTNELIEVRRRLLRALGGVGVVFEATLAEVNDVNSWQPYTVDCAEDEIDPGDGVSASRAYLLEKHGNSGIRAALSFNMN